ncbi:putative nucleic acid-binding protein [Halarchaeum rubridurum]|uniref:Putative nucleic acid-binding protein n=1 Tax=Halarchaeum rubridurum TaxID=489911 RepID=A0A830FRY4_9EURY|nr:hypothetical protein [Halarchaeum rubridurum]MBP1953357.1 putative nucleic acid-binding protein [Halarchaeum rubridurum]GGM65924.1 hypothetical protein GCM10009017_15010 [Halarchaeum rubridurum]
MSDVYLDATTLISLGTIGELERLTDLDGRLVVPSAVREEVTTEPAETNCDRFYDRHDVPTAPEGVGECVPQALSVLGDDTAHGDVHIVAAVLAYTADDRAVGVVSDDRRVRTTCRGLGATVTGTIGVVVRAVDEGLDPDAAKELVSRLDAHGLHLTGELRETAADLIEEAARDADAP